MLKILSQFPCPSCNGKAYIPTSETMFLATWMRLRHTPCQHCKGSGTQTRWIDLIELARLLTAISNDKSLP